jgi:hypothetical protein
MGNVFAALRMDMRKMVGIHQGRERGDVLLTIVLPGFLMLISAYTNAWAFTGGQLSFLPVHLINTLDALFRGLFIEALVFACFKIVKMIFQRSRFYVWPVALVPASFGLWAAIVSAGCGLSWVVKSGSMTFLVKSVSDYLPHWMTGLFQAGVGLLFPMALIIFAVYDIDNLLHEHVSRGGRLGGLAVKVQSAQHHQDMLLKMQKEEDEKLKEQYRQIAQANAKRALESAKRGDLSFGLDDTVQTAPQTYVRPLASPASMPQLPAAGGAPGASLFGQTPVTGQFGPAPLGHSGNTQNIPLPPQGPLPQGNRYGPPSQNWP